MEQIEVITLVVGDFATNCYIVVPQNSSECVVIDPGGEAETIIEKLQQLRLQPRYFFLTHGHLDHVMALPKLQQHYRVPTLVHRQEKTILKSLPAQALMFGLPLVKNPHISEWIEEGRQVQLETINFSVLHTPGHTPGGCCYISDSKIFVGDTLFAGSVGRTDLPGGNYELLISSIKQKLLCLNDDVLVYPGHGPTTTIGAEKQHNPFIR